MANAAAVLKAQERPEGYTAPGWDQVRGLQKDLRRLREPYLSRTWETKKAVRGQWQDVIRHIPAPYRAMLIDPDLPQVRDMIRRVAGLVSKEPPCFEVTPASPRPTEISAAAKEEARLHALRLQIEDQQDRPIYDMGIESQCSMGESWISVWPDPARMQGKEWERGERESAAEYSQRFAAQMADAGVPILMEDHDPQTVFPLWTPTGLGAVIIQTEHAQFDIELGMGYHPLKNADGKPAEWVRKTLSEPFVGADYRSGVTEVDISHDAPPNADGKPSGKPVTKTVYVDCWVYQCYLDGLLVEKWEHDLGYVPVVPAAGELSSDRDPGYSNYGVADAAIRVAKNVVMLAAIMASSAMQHGFPTAFLKNPDHGLVGANGEPLIRSVSFGDLNLLGANEEILFPYLDAKMGPDFVRHLEFLTKQLESSTISNFSEAIGSGQDSGYAIAQIRAMQLSVLGPLYTSAARQWRKIGYIYRHYVQKFYPGGIFLRGAVEETEDGNQYRPILEYAKEHCTAYAINVRISDGIKQDQMSADKMAIEKMQAGAWSPRRAMEAMGVEDPEREQREIDMHRVLRSPAADEVKIRGAVELVAQRLNMTRQAQSSPLSQAIEGAKQTVLGGNQPGQPVNQGAQPVNALPGGQPIAQNPAPAPPPQAGGPTQGPPAEGVPLNGLGIPGIPGGVKGGQPLGPQFAGAAG